MADDKVEVRLQKLLNNELSLSSSSYDKKHVISAYNTLIQILQTRDIRKQLFEQHELLFQCVSQIILTSFNQYFHDDQLRFLLDLTSNACLLSISQNQLIDSWLQNMEERTFEKPDSYDDDHLYEYATESEDDEAITSIENNNNKSEQNAINQHQQKHTYNDDSSHHDLSSVSPNDKTRPLTNHLNSELHTVHVASGDGKYNRQSSGNGSTSHRNKRSDSNINEKRDVDSRLHDFHISGEYDHIQYDCSMKNNPSNNVHLTDLIRKTKQTRSKSSASISSIEIILSKRDQGQILRICNQSTKLINSYLTVQQRNKTFKLLLSRIRKLQKLHGENISIKFYEKESIFYSLVCHVAQNDFLFSNDQYLALYDFQHILLSNKYQLLNKDRIIFCRQRTLIPLNIITEHIRTTSKLQQSILNDFLEHIIRSTSPISTAWKERIVLFKNGNIIPNDFDQWISELDQVFNKTLIKKRKSQKNVLQHAMWYFIILTMASSRHLNQDQYECVLKSGIQSTLFNSKQKFYFQYYLNQGHAPIIIDELNHVEKKLRSQSIDDKILAYEQMIIILDRPKPEFKNEPSKLSDDLIPIIDDHVLLYLISRIEMFSSDAITFTTEQFKELLDKFLHQSTIVRPIPYAEQQRFLSFYSRSISLNELKTHSLSTESDLNHYLLLLKIRPLKKNDKLYDYLTTTVINIFKNRQKFSNEKCQDLKNILLKQSDDLIPIIDDSVRLRLISLVEMISSDVTTFSTEQFKELLDKFLYESTIVRPIPNAEKKRLLSFYTRSISLNELKTYSLSTQSDLNDYILLLKSRPLMKNDNVYDFLTETMINIFKNREKFSNEKCEELKNFLEKNILGKKRHGTINKVYEKFRLNKSNLIIINRTMLNQLLNNILLKDFQAHLELIYLLGKISSSIDVKEITIEFEIYRSLLTAMILIIIDADYSNSSRLILLQKHLTIMIETQTNFFSLLLTEQQYKLITSRSASIVTVDTLMNILIIDLNESHFSNLIHFIQNKLKQETDFTKLTSFLIYTFDNEFLSIEQTYELSNLIFQHSKLDNEKLKHLLQFLIELLQFGIHSSPKIFLKQIEKHQDNDQTINQITIMLTAQYGKYAIFEWIRAMMNLLEILFNRSNNYEQLKDIALQSPMFQKSAFKQQLESYMKKTSDDQSDENKECKFTNSNTMLKTFQVHISSVQ
ncbi:unnamed protein product [Rotaria sp. Silwood2]|nr:unnamed protein product [Rotaria sp. Silwood2]